MRPSVVLEGGAGGRRGIQMSAYKRVCVCVHSWRLQSWPIDDSLINLVWFKTAAATNKTHNNTNNNNNNNTGIPRDQDAQSCNSVLTTPSQ